MQPAHAGSPRPQAVSGVALARRAHVRVHTALGKDDTSISCRRRALPLLRSPSAVALHSFCCGCGLLLLRPFSPGAATLDGRGGNTSCCCGRALLLRSCTPGVATPRQRRWCQHCQYYAHLARRYHSGRLEQPALRCGCRPAQLVARADARAQVEQRASIERPCGAGREQRCVVCEAQQDARWTAQAASALHAPRNKPSASRRSNWQLARVQTGRRTSTLSRLPMASPACAARQAHRGNFRAWLEVPAPDPRALLRGS